MAAPSFGISVTVNQRDIDRINKRLDKWQGKPLALRMEKALQAGMRLYIAPLKARAATHNLTGAVQRGYNVRKLRKRPGEAAAYKAGSKPWYKHFAIAGTSRGVEADPYVDAVHDQMEPSVTAFISDQVARLA